MRLRHVIWTTAPFLASGCAPTASTGDAGATVVDVDVETPDGECPRTCTFSFDQLGAGQTGTAEFAIVNHGTAAVHVDSMAFLASSDPSFSLGATLPDAVAPDERATFDVQVTHFVEASISGTLEIRLVEEEEPFTIELSVSSP